MASKYLLSSRQVQDKSMGEESSRWVGLIDKLRPHTDNKNGGEHSHTRNISTTFHDVDYRSDACSPTSLVESMSGEILALRERLESVESTKLEFVTLCSHLEDEMEKSHCVSHAEMEQMKMQNEALIEENTRLADEFQTLKRANARLVDDYSKRELEYLNHMNDTEKALRQTSIYYESKIIRQNAVIASLCNEIKRTSGMSHVICVDEVMLDNSKQVDPADIISDAFDISLNKVDDLIVAGRRVPLLEGQLREAEQTIALLRDEVKRLTDQRMVESDLNWLELQACGRSLHDKGISTTVL
jgi:uncharacterized small protein (DUF1192 family)